MSNVSPTKRPHIEESRSLHPGLRQMSVGLLSSTPIVRSIMPQPSNKNFTTAVDQYQMLPSVQFDERTINKYQSGILTKRSDDSASMVTGANAVEAPNDPKTPVGLQLHNRVTGNNKTLSRKLREKRYNKEDLNGEEEEKLSVDTVM